MNKYKINSRRFIVFGIFSVNLLLLSLASISTAQELKLNEIVDKLEQQDKTIKSVQFNLTQEVNIKVTGEKRKIIAKVVYLKPNKIYIEYSLPQKQTVISNGKKIWVKIPGYDQVMATDWSTWVKSGFFPKEILDFGSTMKSMKKKYNLSLSGYEDGYYLIVLEPSKNKDFGLKIWVSDKTWFPEKMELFGETFLVVTSADNLEVNQEIDEKMFQIQQ